MTTVPRACQITTTFALLNTVPNDEYKGFLARKMLEWNEACPKEDAAAAPDAPRSVSAESGFQTHDITAMISQNRDIKHS